MTIKMHTRYVFALLLPLLIGGCSTIKIREKIRMPSSRKRNLSHLDAFSCDHQQTNNGVTIRIKTLRTQQDCIDLFGKNGKNLIRKKKKTIYPVHVTLENKTNSTWMLPPENVGLNLTSERLVAGRVGYWTGVRSILTGGFLFCGASAIASASTPFIPFIIYSGATLSIAAMCVCAPAVIAAGILTAIIPPTIIVRSIRSRNANKQIKKMLKKTSIKNSIQIKAHTTRSFLFFVKKQDYKSRFIIVMTDEQDDTLLFNIHAPTV